MAKFVLLLHDDPNRTRSISPSEMQAIIGRYKAWAGALAAEGRLGASHKLVENGGRHVRRAGATITATDGPYAEAREVIGGLFVVEAADMAAAEDLARTCPHIDNGWIEVRAIETT